MEPVLLPLRGNTARNVREGRIIKTSTTDRLLYYAFFYVERNMNGYCLAIPVTVTL